MKTMGRLLVCGALCAIALTMVIRTMGQQQGVTTKEFMREKLEHSQNALKALAEEDYFTLGKDAKRLSAMTQEARWQASQDEGSQSTGA